MNASDRPVRPARKFFAMGVVLAAAGVGCNEQPKPGAPPTPMDRVMEENQRAAEALFHAAQDAARQASDRAQEAADAAKEAVDALSAGAKSGFSDPKGAPKGN